MSLNTVILEAGTPVDQDLRVTRGDSPRIRFIVRVKETGAVQPIGTGCAVELKLVDLNGDTILTTIAGNIDDQANGTGYIDMSTAQTTALPYPTQTDDTLQEAVVGRWTIALTESTNRKTIGKGKLLVFSPTDP